LEGSFRFQVIDGVEILQASHRLTNLIPVRDP
jgi:hypothetical protein